MYITIMKKYVLPALRLTLIFAIFFCAIYTFIVMASSMLVPEKFSFGKMNNGYYYSIGQKFSSDKYFWSRPSAVEYNAAASGGSNKGPSNPDYLHSVQLRIDTLLHYNPDIELSDIPWDIVTASGSGLDPHISVQAAMIQVPRISKIRKVSPDILKKTIKDLTEKPMFGIFGTEKIHVLTLNLALDSISHF